MCIDFPGAYDPKAEEYIISWARDFPENPALKLVIYLDNFPQNKELSFVIEQAVQQCFAYEADLVRHKHRQLMKEGSFSLTIGLFFLTVCLIGAELIGRFYEGAFLGVLKESLIIARWFAMWRPMEIFLYEPWPLRRMERLYNKLSLMPVEIKEPSSIRLPLTQAS